MEYTILFSFIIELDGFKAFLNYMNFCMSIVDKC